MSADEWDARYRDAGLLWTGQANRSVAAELEGVAPGRALDLGCGEGRNAVWLAEQGWTVTAVDFSSVGLDKGRALAAARNVEVDWLLEDLRDNAEHGCGGPPDPTVLWDVATLARQLTRLTVERAAQVTREVSTEDGPRNAIDTLVRARRAARLPGETEGAGR